MKKGRSTTPLFLFALKTLTPRHDMEFLLKYDNYSVKNLSQDVAFSIFSVLSNFREWRYVHSGNSFMYTG